MRIPSLLLVASLVVTVAGCLDSPASPSELDREVELAPGQAVTLADGDVRLEFHGVASDNRCPTDVDCIHAGDAVVQLSVTAGGRTEEVELHTGSPRSAQHEGVTIELVRLLPNPISTRKIRPEEYRATLRVTRE